jgi:hypothetical protein
VLDGKCWSEWTIQRVKHVHVAYVLFRSSGIIFSLFYHSEKNKLNIPSNRLANWRLLILLLMRKPHMTFHHGSTTFITIDFITSMAWTHLLLCLHDTREYVEITYSGWCQGPCGCTTSTGHVAGTSQNHRLYGGEKHVCILIKLYGSLLECGFSGQMTTLVL